MPPFSKVLVANRGEIAIRVFRTLRELGIGTVAVYSEADRASLHVEYADEAYPDRAAPGGGELPARSSASSRPPPARAPKRSTPATGSWPRTRRFARACADAGIVWIGPPPEAIEAMGSKVEARERMKAAGVPIIPGTTEPVETVEDDSRLAEEIGYPLAIKAAVGRRGKGPQGGPLARRGRARVLVGAARGRGLLRRSDRLRRAVPRGSTPRRGAGPGRRARQRRPPRRARLHDPAPPPEAGRGDAVAGSLGGAARADRRDRRRCRPRRRLPKRGDDRGAALARGRVLLPRDEHADSGRASGHGAGHRLRPRARTGADRGRRAALVPPGGRPVRRPRDRVPDQRRGRGGRISAGARDDHGLSRACRPGRARRLRRRRGIGGLRHVRPA